jgi:hypothetical protein
VLYCYKQNKIAKSRNITLVFCDKCLLPGLVVIVHVQEGRQFKEGNLENERLNKKIFALSSASFKAAGDSGEKRN